MRTLLAVFVAAGCLVARELAGQDRHTVQAPYFEVDPFWPKPLPNGWILGMSIGVAVDARDGVTAGDEIIAQTLRRSGKPVIFAANKCEGRTSLEEVYGLGLGEPIRLSAEHALGMGELAEALEEHIPRLPPSEEEIADTEEESEAEDFDWRDKPLRLALVGRPNVGKSSLFNLLLGEERSLTGPEAGLTRDAITAP